VVGRDGRLAQQTGVVAIGASGETDGERDDGEQSERRHEYLLVLR
jgi:hypothetical protein